MPEAMEMYLLNEKNITVRGYWPLDEFPKEVCKEYLNTIKHHTEYFYLKCNNIDMVLKDWSSSNQIILPISHTVPYHAPMPQVFFNLIKEKL